MGTWSGAGYVKNTAGRITVSRTDIDGAVSGVNNNGIALADDQSINVHFGNSVDDIVSVEVKQEANAGADNSIIDDAEMKKKYHGDWSALDEDSYQLDCMPGYQADFTLPFSAGNHGGRIIIRMFYKIHDDATGEDVKIYVGDLFVVNVVNFRINAIKFVGNEKLMVDATRAVPKPEWVLDGRDKAPQPGQQYHDTVSAPAAFVRNNPIKMEVKYECAGESSVTFFGECITGPTTQCPYGNMGDTTITNCGAGKSGTITVSSLQSNTVVSASLIHYKWKTKNISTGGPQDPTIRPVVDTYHRVYTLLNPPVTIGWSRGPGDQYAWIQTLEIAANLAQGATGEFSLKSKILRGIYNSSWQSQNWNFLHPMRKVTYSKSGYKSLCGDLSKIDIISKLMSTIPWGYDLPNLLSQLQIQTSEPLIADCGSYNGFMLVLDRHLGGTIYGRHLIDKRTNPGYYLTLKCVYPSGMSDGSTGYFYRHWTTTENLLGSNKYWDSTNALSSTGEYLNCQNTIYQYVESLQDTVYLDLFFMNPPQYITSKLWYITTINPNPATCPH